MSRSSTVRCSAVSFGTASSWRQIAREEHRVNATKLRGERAESADDGDRHGLVSARIHAEGEIDPGVVSSGFGKSQRDERHDFDDLRLRIAIAGPVLERPSEVQRKQAFGFGNASAE